MDKRLKTKEITYVLFGKEAIKLYRLSRNTLINSIDVSFKVGAYSSVKQFVSDALQWDDFIEIPEVDYLKLSNVAAKDPQYKTRKKSFFTKFFK